MFYTIYKITNKINGKIYIGKHRTSDLSDGYMGSGKLIQLAITKYGIESFNKEILFEFTTEKEMNSMETELVTEEFISRSDTYNLCIGGHGGFGYINKHELSGRHIDPEFHKKGRAAANKVGAHIKGNRSHISKLNNDPVYRTKWRNAIESSGTWDGTFLGKSHTDETKQKMSKAKSGLYDGANNPNYGNCWIYSLTEKRSKCIRKEDLDLWIADGWRRGRKMKF